MLTIEGLISVLGLCLTCFGLGYAIGSKAGIFLLEDGEGTCIDHLWFNVPATGI